MPRAKSLGPDPESKVPEAPEVPELAVDEPVVEPVVTEAPVVVLVTEAPVEPVLPVVIEPEVIVPVPELVPEEVEVETQPPGTPPNTDPVFILPPSPAPEATTTKAPTVKLIPRYDQNIQFELCSIFYLYILVSETFMYLGFTEHR